MIIFNKALIIGLGLIGGSMAIAIKKRGLVQSLLAADTSREALEVAREKNIIDGTVELPAGVSDVNLIILATPVLDAGEILEQISPHLSPGTIITDVSSTKEQIVKLASSILPGNVCFIGGHPMTGSERNGFTSAKGELFENANYILTPERKTRYVSVVKLKMLLKAIGATPLEMSPNEHDKLISVVSHLPHLIATALVNTLAASSESDRLINLVAGGFRDTTRIASSDSRLWQQILLSNRQELIKTLDKFTEIIGKYKEILNNNDEQALLDYLETARITRNSFIKV